MADVDVIVVGGGIFGQTIAGLLHRRGQVVRVLDDGRPHSGSWPSACLMKPSWLTAISTANQDRSYEVLDNLFGVHELRFKVGPFKLDTVRWCDPAKIRQGVPVLKAEVKRVAGFGETAIVDALIDQRFVTLTARKVVVAAGSWTHHLVPGCPPVEAKVGAACLWDGQHIENNIIDAWAPYRQLVAFNMVGVEGRKVWAGDGTAVKPGSWTAVREQEIMARCAKKTGLPLDAEEGFEFRIGRRPYLDKRIMYGRPCYVANHDGIWVATGGAKNGTIAAGWAAAELAEKLA